MFGRSAVAGLAIAVVASPATALAAINDRTDLALNRDDDAAEVMVAEDDGDDFTGASGNSGTGNSGTGNSNDGTGSGHTAVSADRDRSVGDKTRDWTRDGSGDRKRDWSGGQTNDRSGNDTR